MATFYIYKQSNDLIHYGILGMKWGVRKYQNKDGSLTNAGKNRYGSKSLKTSYKIDNVIGPAALAWNSNRKREYNYQKQLAKSDPNYKENKKEIIEKIRNDRSSEAAGAFLKDLGYEDTPEGRKEILQIFDSKELKKMSDINEISTVAQIGLLGLTAAKWIVPFRTAFVSGFTYGYKNSKNMLNAFDTFSKNYESAQKTINETQARVSANTASHYRDYEAARNLINEGRARVNSNITTWDNVPISTFDNVSSEYLEQLAYNSRKNIYPNY